MIGISKGMVAAAAVIAFGLVSVEDMTKGPAKPAAAHTQSQNSVSDSTVIEQGVLRERATATLRALLEQQKAERAGAKPAEKPKCLVRPEGAEPRRVVRVVQVDRPVDGAVMLEQA
jgi:hypothetical protein